MKRFTYITIILLALSSCSKQTDEVADKHNYSQHCDSCFNNFYGKGTRPITN